MVVSRSNDETVARAWSNVNSVGLFMCSWRGKTTIQPAHEHGPGGEGCRRDWEVKYILSHSLLGVSRFYRLFLPHVIPISTCVTCDVFPICACMQCDTKTASPLFIPRPLLLLLYVHTQESPSPSHTAPLYNNFPYNRLNAIADGAREPTLRDGGYLSTVDGVVVKNMLLKNAGGECIRLRGKHPI